LTAHLQLTASDENQRDLFLDARISMQSEGLDAALHNIAQHQIPFPIEDAQHDLIGISYQKFWSFEVEMVKF
jgi:hypothetical protein